MLYNNAYNIRLASNGDAMSDLQNSKGNETILIVDDEHMVRNMLIFYLKDFGYQIMTAEDGEEAIKIFKQHVDTIKAVIMDVVMPHKDGITAYGEMKKINPDANIFLISGNPNSLAQLEKSPTIPFIAKPFNPYDIADKIRASIDRTA